MRLQDGLGDCVELRNVVLADSLALGRNLRDAADDVFLTTRRERALCNAQSTTKPRFR